MTHTIQENTVQLDQANWTLCFAICDKKAVHNSQYQDLPWEEMVELISKPYEWYKGCLKHLAQGKCGIEFFIIFSWALIKHNFLFSSTMFLVLNWLKTFPGWVRDWEHLWKCGWSISNHWYVVHMNSGELCGPIWRNPPILYWRGQSGTGRSWHHCLLLFWVS